MWEICPIDRLLRDRAEDLVSEFGLTAAKLL
jgi:hypothetical protein